MAFLRFHRDKRGYEHFYLVESTTGRRGKPRTRVLYWFRTPPNVKVGREPFDQEVRRTLEAQYPGVTFDWQKIAETPTPSADAERWRERRRLEKAAKAARRAGVEPSPAEIHEDDAEADVSAMADIDAAVDAAEQQADALEPTEASLLSTAATVEPAVEAPESNETGGAQAATDQEPARTSQEPARNSRRRRRRRRRGQRSSSPAESHAALPPEDTSEPPESGEPGESG